MNQPTPIRKSEDPFEPEPTKTHSPLMHCGYWLFLLLTLIIVGDFALMFAGTITGTEGRDLFVTMGIPTMTLFGVVIGFVLRRTGKRL